MKMQSLNPATNQVFAEFEMITLDEAVAFGRVSKAAQKKWARLSFSDRASFVKKLGTVIREQLEDAAKLATLEMGKPITQSRTELEKCAALCDFYAEHGAEFLAPEVIKTEATMSYIRFDPLGVVLGIMPWNFPFWQVIRFAVPALLAGNGALLKHASNVPQCALKLEAFFVAAGFPDGLFKTLLIDGPSASEIIKTDVVDAVSLTGSTEAGARVASIAGQHLKKCVLELGGSDPFIVFADANLAKAAVAAVQARMVNGGQSCIAAKRFLVEKSISAEFEKLVESEFKKLVMGDPMDEKTTVGPLARLDLADGIEKQVLQAVAAGARLVCGGKRVGAFFEPTILADIKPGMAPYAEEVFGPVLSVIEFSDEVEAVTIANSTEFGLGASVWTSSRERGERLAGEIESGFIAINNIVRSDPRLPFGGVKKSGYGRELGSFGIREFVNVKTVVIAS